MIKRRLREYGQVVAVIVGFMIISTVAGGYILHKQRLRLPFEHRYTMYVELETSQSVTPGLGQPVNVAGVRVGDIVSTTLRGGRSRMKLAIDPGKLKRIYTNGGAFLHPNTPLKDMQIDLRPGGPPAKPLPRGGTIPIAQTVTPVDSDELTAALDGDTRTYFQALISALQGGLHGRGADMRALFKALGPTTEQTRQITDLLAARRVKVARLVHNLALLTSAANERDADLGQVVAAGDATLRAVASQDVALGRSLDRLPRTLRVADSSVRNLTAFSRQLRPTLNSLFPAARKLPAALRDAKPLIATAEPLIRTQLRPFVREAQPLARDLAPTVASLDTVTPDLTNSFKVLNYVANELVYNPPGKEEGYLFWLAWFAHNANSMTSTQDANGSVWRGLAVVSCQGLAEFPPLSPLFTLIAGVAPCP